MDIDIRDHDGSLLTTRACRTWNVAGHACTEIATSPRVVQRDADGRPFVTLRFGEVAGMRLRGEMRYWLGID